MMTSKTKTLKIFLLLIVCISLNAQAQQPGATLSQQYEEVVKKAGSYLGHKEIKETKLQALWRNAMDSLQKERQVLKETRAKLVSNGQATASLKADLSAKKQDLTESKAQVDELRLLGIPMNKTTYNIMMWGLIFLLGVTLALVLFRSRTSVKEAQYRIGLFNDLFGEFQRHKTNSNDREKKLARELQTERNKMAEFSGHSR